MKISKTTLNFASKRNIELEVSNDVIEFYEAGEDCEPMFTYNNNEETLSFRGNVYLKQSIKEELPATIFNEKQLRVVISFVSEELAK